MTISLGADTARLLLGFWKSTNRRTCRKYAIFCVVACYCQLPKAENRPGKKPAKTGRSAAWLARLTGGQEVASSNLAVPTNHP